jgi:hypothetical protein
MADDTTTSLVDLTTGLARRGHAKYDAQVKAGLLDDPAALARIRRDETRAAQEAKKPSRLPRPESARPTEAP